MIEITYRDILLQEFINDQLSRGIALSADDIEDKAAELAGLDLSIPQFQADNYLVTTGNSFSSSNTRSTFTNVRQDLKVLYRDLSKLVDKNTDAFERWKLEAEDLEKKLITLEDRIENLLLLTQDTDGYFSVVVDNFEDSQFTDTNLTTANLNLKTNSIELATDSSDDEAFSKIVLDDFLSTANVSFKVRTTIDFLSREDAVGSSLLDPFYQETNRLWWTNIKMRRQSPVTCELTVVISDSNPIPLNKIVMELHQASEASPINITPLYSEDNRTFNQLPTVTFTTETKHLAVFTFNQINAKYIKFLLTKRGADLSSSEDFFSYQFGFKEISFFKESFIEDSSQVFISEPRFVLSTSTNEPVEFEKLTLETCEKIEEDTSIDYSITTSNNSLVPITDDTVWVPIIPINRGNKSAEQVLVVGDATEITIGDIEDVGISYDASAEDDSLINPSSTFNLLSRDSGSGEIVDTITTSSSARYIFSNPQDRILSYQMQLEDTDGDNGINLNENSLVLFRNIGEKGLDGEDPDNQVRDAPRGWRFSEPYYSTIIEITNENGMSLDFGSESVIIDGAVYTNKVDNTILFKGYHNISIHKKNFIEVTSSLNSLEDLQAADTLYPFNHKLLIEGYLYGDSYPLNEEQVYKGVDLFASHLMKKVSVFDFINNIPVTGYEFFAVDLDAPSSHDITSGGSTRVFLVKVDNDNPDFQNEKFLFRFRLTNELRKYLRLKATISTSSTTVTPVLFSYKIKLG